jgi:hypothetical protein
MNQALDGWAELTAERDRYKLQVEAMREAIGGAVEECARVCDELYSDTAWHPYYRQAANNCAETIRAKIHQWRDIKVVGKDAIRVLAPREQNAAKD